MNAQSQITAAASLPVWAQCPRADAIIADILRDPPMNTIADAMGFKVQHYAGKPARQLRDLFDDQLEAITAAERAEWEAGRSYDELTRQANALLRSERPDQLIKRLLDEAMSLAPVVRISASRIGA
ncbi:MAG: hypothetical protein V4696_01635 [Pseudomonadota bacterium]